MSGRNDDEVPVEIRDAGAGGEAEHGAGGGTADAPPAAPSAFPGAASEDAAGGGSDEAGATPGGSDEGAVAPSSAPSDGADLRSQLSAAEARIGELDAQLRRALADYRNLERRSRADVDAAVRDRVARFAADMISVRDDFERAAKATAAGAAGAGANAHAAEAVSAGLDTVLRGMDAALSKHGVEPIDALGEIFDPHKHEAVATAEDAALDEGTITSVAARGYMLDERIIRPARVVISKRPDAGEASV